MTDLSSSTVLCWIEMPIIHKILHMPRLHGLLFIKYLYFIYGWWLKKHTQFHWTHFTIIKHISTRSQMKCGFTKGYVSCDLWSTRDSWTIVFVLKSAASHPESGLMLEFFLLSARRVSEDVSAVSEGVWCISNRNSHSSSACSPLSLAGGRCLDKLMPYQAESCCY